MNKFMVDVSIILVNYNTLKLTTNCIESIRENSEDVTYEIIIVDNASTDGSIEYFSMQSDIKFIESGGNIGFGRANNLGAQYALGKYLLFLNTDTIFLNDVLSNFCRFMDNDIYPTKGVLGSWLLDQEGNVITSLLHFPSIWNYMIQAYSFIRRKIKKGDNQHAGEHSYEVKKVDAVSGANMFMRKEVFELCGGFDPTYFMYGEETELSYRINKCGYDSFIIPSPRIIHLEGGSSKKNRKISFFQFYNMKRGHILFYRKHKSAIYCILALLLEFPLDFFFVLIDDRFKGKRGFFLKQYKYLFPFTSIESPSIIVQTDRQSSF